MESGDPGCACLEGGPRHDAATRTYIGVDETDGRFADVEVLVCHSCGRTWLSYRFEIEAFSRSGRWYMGIVAPDALVDLAPADAPRLLETLPWHLVGGSYFEGGISRRSGPLLGL